MTGEQCRLFDDDSGLAAELEAGQHLLTCFGDEGIIVDRFDARLLLPAAPIPPRSRAGASAPDSEEEAELDAERYRDLGGDGSEPSDSEADDANPRQGLMIVTAGSCLWQLPLPRFVDFTAARWHRDSESELLMSFLQGAQPFLMTMAATTLRQRPAFSRWATTTTISSRSSLQPTSQHRRMRMQDGQESSRANRSWRLLWSPSHCRQTCQQPCSSTR